MDIHNMMLVGLSFYTCPNCGGTGQCKYELRYRKPVFRTIRGGKNQEFSKVIRVTDSKHTQLNTLIPYCPHCGGTGELTEIHNHNNDYDEENM